MITINFIHSTSDHPKIVSNMVRGFKECNIPYAVNGLVQDYDYNYSISKFIDTTQYPNKLFIFGPQFGSFEKFTSSMANNSIYIQPSEPSINIRNALGFRVLPMKSYCIGVDTDEFNSGNSEGIPFVYFKHRKQEDVDLVYDFMKSNNIKFHKIIYGTYKEEQYKDILRTAPYGIWVGSQESQGLAVEEALSCNVPLLVWNITKRGDEYPLSKTKEKVKDMFATTIPYWDTCCGAVVYSFQEFADNFHSFVSNVPTYKPRQFIVKELSLSKRAHAFLELFHEIRTYRYDFYLIWNHGMKNLDKIRNIICENKSLTICKEFQQNVGNITAFIKTLYILDVKNKKHIESKTKYLLHEPPNIHIFIIRNISKTPEESLNETKWKVREQFNPRFKDLTHHPHPRLPAGITHNHVIHGSDTEEETMHILKHFNICI